MYAFALLHKNVGDVFLRHSVGNLAMLPLGPGLNVCLLSVLKPWFLELRLHLACTPALVFSAFFLLLHAFSLSSFLFSEPVLQKTRLPRVLLDFLPLISFHKVASIPPM